MKRHTFQPNGKSLRLVTFCGRVEVKVLVVALLFADNLSVKVKISAVQALRTVSLLLLVAPSIAEHYLFSTPN